MNGGIVREWLGAWLARLVGADWLAMERFGRVLARYRSVVCARQLAALAMRSGEFELAEATLARLVSWRPRSAADWHELARVRRRMGRWQDAIEALRRVTQLLPACDEAWFDLADAHIALREYAYAIPPLRRAQALLPESTYPLYLIGICQHHCGNDKVLRELIERVAAVDLRRASLMLKQTGRTDWRIPGLSC